MLFLKYVELIDKIEIKEFEKELKIRQKELELELEKIKQNHNYEIVYHSEIGFPI